MQKVSKLYAGYGETLSRIITNLAKFEDITDIFIKVLAEACMLFSCSKCGENPYFVITKQADFKLLCPNFCKNPEFSQVEKCAKK